jgi:hypothetical protein
MTALCRLVIGVFVGTVGVSAVPAEAQTASPVRVGAGIDAVLSARVSPGGIQGVVLDDRGAPLRGAMVSALGLTTAFAVTDARGRFALAALPPGPYVLRAHLGGYGPSRARVVQVSPDASAISTIALRAVGSDRLPSDARDITVMTAGFGGSGQVTAIEPGNEAEIDADDHDHSETAWKLRHVGRSVLKDAAMSPVQQTDEEPGSGAWIPGHAVRAANAAARMAASVIADLPLKGEVNLLTTGTLDAPERLFSPDRASRSVAYIAIGAPAGAGDWSVQGAMTQGDLASWVLSGSYAARATSRHAYDVGMSYSMQRYDGGNPAALAAVTDGTRNVGDVYGFDRWTLSRHVTLAYGAHYSNYGYLDRGSLLSPRAAITISPVQRVRIDALVSRRMLAPGAEEFLPPSSGNVWLPPERTFSSLESDGAFRPERTDHFQVEVQHDLAARTFVGARTYYQRVNDQLLTVFDMASDDIEEIGHYYVGNVGSFEARGWGASVGHAVGERLRGVVDYSVTTAHWQATPDPELTSLSAAGAPRTIQRIHDIRTAISADIPETATRVFLVYRINNAFMSETADEGAGAPRFDLQINQRLPFMNLMATEWEMLVAVRNLFREAAFDGSVYDELLVVRPPKRIVGGLTVRF